MVVEDDAGNDTDDDGWKITLMPVGAVAAKLTVPEKLPVPAILIAAGTALPDCWTDKLDVADVKEKLGGNGFT
jgi:hypothetical protein